jgi:hypothetical protein
MNKNTIIEDMQKTEQFKNFSVWDHGQSVKQYFF